MECRIHIPQSLPINKSLTIFSVNSGYTLLYCLHIAYSRWDCRLCTAARTCSPSPAQGASPRVGGCTLSLAGSGCVIRAPSCHEPRFEHLLNPESLCPLLFLLNPWGQACVEPWSRSLMGHPCRQQDSAHPSAGCEAACTAGAFPGHSNFHFMNK